MAYLWFKEKGRPVGAADLSEWTSRTIADGKSKCDWKGTGADLSG